MAPPPYASPTCRNDGCDDPPLDLGGPFRGFCATHKEQTRLARRAARLSGAPKQAAPERAERVERIKLPQLSRTVQDLVPKAERLEQAIEHREEARSSALTALADFKEGLTLVGRVAQSLVNVRAESQ